MRYIIHLRAFVGLTWTVVDPAIVFLTKLALTPLGVYLNVQFLMYLCTSVSGGKCEIILQVPSPILMFGLLL